MARTLIPETSKKTLTHKQQLFADAYVKHFNATAAAREAGYSGSTQTLSQTGHQNLRVPKIAARIEQLLSDSAMSAHEVLSRLGQQARGDHSQFWEISRRGYATFNLEALIRSGNGHLIKDIELDPITSRPNRIRFHDSQNALALIGRHHALFTDKHDHSGEISGPVLNITVNTENGSNTAPQTGDSTPKSGNRNSVRRGRRSR